MIYWIMNGVCPHVIDDIAIVSVTIEIVDFPIKDGDFHVNLPEGRFSQAEAINHQG